MVSAGERLLSDVGQRIAECRRARGLTQSALAERAGTTVKYVQRAEAGNENLTLESLAKWASALRVPPRELLRPPTTGRSGRGRPKQIRQVPFPSARRSARAVPVYRFRPVAGGWGDWQPGGIAEWVRVESLSGSNKGLFIAQVQGSSMEPEIRNEDWCLFLQPWWPKSGETGVFWRSETGDAEDGGHFTLKQYAPVAKGGRVEATLRPRNPAFPPLTGESDGGERPLARFLRVLARN